MTHLRSRLLLTALVALSVVALTGFGCRQSSTTGEKNASTIVVWGLWQNSTMMAPIIDAFQKQYGVKVDYKKIASVATYQTSLLQALAQGQGPDVFVIHHTWVTSKSGIMSPAPNDIVSEADVQKEFVDVVDKDLVQNGAVYALPTSVDNLALYYNKDLFNAAGLAQPPKTWDEFQTDVQQLTQVSRLGVITQSGAALGAAANINRSMDILQALMLQSGLNIFNTQTSQSDISSDVGKQALTFYTDFTNKSKKVFTWDLQQDYSLDAFASGKTAMMISYSYNMPTIQAKNPRLNMGIAPLPQIAGATTPMTLASYWPFAVATTSRFPRTAWEFVRFLTNDPQVVALNAAQGTPPARRNDITALKNDPIMGVFATQALQATSWPRLDIDSSDAIFNKLVDDVVTGASTIDTALSQAKDQLEAIKKPNVTQ
jgi:multiple sugar transport system substrate-binding protein